MGWASVGRPLGSVLGATTCFTAILAAAYYALDTWWVDTAVLMLAGLGQVLAFLWFRAAAPRAICSLVLLAAALSAAAQLYSAIWWWDILMHFVTLHALVWMAWNRALTGSPGLRARARSRPGEAFALCAVVGFLIAIVWEVMELLGFLFVTPEIHIPLLDTLGDVAVGVLGAALVGFHREPR